MSYEIRNRPRSARGASVAQWLELRSAESEGLRFDSSWALRIFSLSHARDKTKKHLSLIKYHYVTFVDIEKE